MRVRFLLGPAGSGKTFRCQEEIRAALKADPAGPPLVWLAPRQATFQLERQLLADPALPGYTRLHILSFERLAEFVLEQLHHPPGPALTEEGRVMVLRALLMQHADQLRIFHGSARLPGLAQQLSQALRKFQHHQQSASGLATLAARLGPGNALGDKMHDIGLMLRAYQAWLHERDLQDPEASLNQATEALHGKGKWRRENGEAPPPSAFCLLPSAFPLAGLWLDGFAELTPQELAFLTALLPYCEQAVLAFCLREERDVGWLSVWSTVGRSYRKCRSAVESLPDCEISVERLDDGGGPNRYGGRPVLAHLERCWAAPQPFAGPWSDSLRVAICTDPEAEAILAAREIRRFVRSGGRYRDCAVLLRQFEGYDDPLRRIFGRYDIPFFLDRRQPIAHHPLAELTRYAVRLAALGWQHEDWFGALKTGLVHADESVIDGLENEALARGWTGEAWLRPLTGDALPQAHQAGEDGTRSTPGGSTQSWERLREKLVPPFQSFYTRLAGRDHRPSGAELAAALRTLWDRLNVGRTLQRWGESGRKPETRSANRPALQVHRTVWEQMHQWLESLALAFAEYRLSLVDWLPILEAGLGGLTVGLIPPALDQVLIGSVDRSRNPDLQLAFILGLNESVFPAKPSTAGLLTEADRRRLESEGMDLGQTCRAQLAQEQYYAYIAFTRPRRRLVASCAALDSRGRTQNPSRFLRQLQGLFPGLEPENYVVAGDWLASEHPSELLPSLLQAQAAGPADPDLNSCLALPALAAVREQCRTFQTGAAVETLSPAIAAQLYGATLRVPVTRLEEFAACPFKFFVSNGLRAQERKQFELEAREQGSFQHHVLAEFHRQLATEGKAWRDLSPAEARARIGRIGALEAEHFQDGLLQADAQARFTAQSLVAALQDFMEIAVGWFHQYEFNPQAVELGFGLDERGLPAWELELERGQRLAVCGKIDRIDCWRDHAADRAYCVVIDYKAGGRRLDPLLLQHGVQLQLPAYLNVLWRLASAAPRFGASTLVPAGLFYVNLRGRYQTGDTREEVLGQSAAARQIAYQHTGRFDAALLRRLDNRPEATEGDQFKYRLNQDGSLSGRSAEALASSDFLELLGATEQRVRQLGQRILAGDVRVDPYQKGTQRACDLCDFRSVCRVDPWTHHYRVLQDLRAPVSGAAATDHESRITPTPTQARPPAPPPSSSE